MNPSPGETILNGTYEIERELWQGASARVYLVRHLALDVERAVKAVSRDAPGVGSTLFSDYAQRFQLEAQLGARLDHPNVIKAHDFEADDDGLCLVMEYAAGGSLADRLRDGPLSIDDFLSIAIDTASGLGAIHEQLQAVHRNIKPSNILIDGEGRAKVGDLGLAQVPGGMSQRSRLGSEAGFHPGTPQYMSPEQEREYGYLQCPSDVYSLGCVLFEMLTGKAYRAQRPGTRVGMLRPDAPAWIDGIILRCLAEDREDRPWDGNEVAGILRRGAQDSQSARDQAEQERRLRKGRDQKQGGPRVTVPEKSAALTDSSLQHTEQADGLPGRRAISRRAFMTVAAVAGGSGILGTAAWLALRPRPQPGGDSADAEPADPYFTAVPKEKPAETPTSAPTRAATSVPPEPTKGIAPSAPPIQRHTLRTQFLWIKNVEFNGFYAADIKGFYEDEGLQVELMAGGPGVDTQQIMDARQAEIGLHGSGSSFINAVAGGSKHIMFAAIFQRSPAGLMYLLDNPIATPQDAVGKRIGLQDGAIQGWQVICSRNGLDCENDMEIVSVSWDPSALADGTVDGYWCYATNQPGILRLQGFDVGVLDPWDWGLRTYGNFAIVHEDFLKENRDAVVRWTRASIRGWVYADNHIDEITQYTVDTFGADYDLNMEQQVDEAAAQVDYVVSDLTERKGLFWFDKQVWRENIDLLIELGELAPKDAPNVEDFTTYDILEEVYEDGKEALGQ